MFVNNIWLHHNAKLTVCELCTPQPSSIVDIPQSDSPIYVIGGKIYYGQKGRIYDLHGRDVTQKNGSLPKGVYIVQTENKKEKVRVF